MKTYFWIVVLIFMACSERSSQSIAIMVARDITDPENKGNEQEAISKFLHKEFRLEASGAKWDGRTLILTQISDIVNNQNHIVKIDPVPNIWERDSKARLPQIQSFKKEMEDEVRALFLLEAGRNQTKFLKTVVNKIQYLSGLEADRKILICCSDLFENTDRGFYETKDIDSIPIKLDSLSRNIFLPLSGNSYNIQIMVVHTPTSTVTDDKFTHCLTWFTKKMGLYGIRVDYHPNL